MEDVWLAYAKRVQALAATGQHYTRDDFDRERFEELDDISRQMIGALGEVPLNRLVGLPHRDEGYATPKIDIRAAVIREGRILLVREARDGKWTMPGGFADIGVSPADNAVKETWEEATLRVRATKLIQVRHRAKEAEMPDWLDFYKFFFLCEALDDSDPAPGSETMDAGFFDPAVLPEMSLGRSNPDDISRAILHWKDPSRATEWD